MYESIINDNLKVITEPGTTLLRVFGLQGWNQFKLHRYNKSYFDSDGVRWLFHGKSVSFYINTKDVRSIGLTIDQRGVDAIEANKDTIANAFIESHSHPDHLGCEYRADEFRRDDWIDCIIGDETVERYRVASIDFFEDDQVVITFQDSDTIECRRDQPLFGVKMS